MLRTDLIRPIPELLATHARARGDRLAFRDARRSVSYAELYVRTGRLARHLARRGLEPGARAALLLRNGVDAIETYLAITRAAGIGVCLNPQDGREDLAFKLVDAGCRIVITEATYLPRVLDAADLPELRHIVVVTDTHDAAVGDGDRAMSRYETLATEEPSEPPRDSLELDAPAWMLYTSGTTGRPKGVLLSQRNNLWVIAACWVPMAGPGSEDYLLSPLPLYHSYALNLPVLAVVALGASEYIMERFSTAELLRLLKAEPFTFMPGVPTMFHFLLEAARDEGLGTESLRTCVSAGAILPASLNRAFEDAFGVPLLDGYGITETATMVTENCLTGTRVMGSCGLPLPGSAVRIVNPETGVDVGIGEEGELWVRGPHVMLGYHNRPEETASALEGGWYHIGDLGRSDENGYLTITGRIKELIIRGGENIAPAEVEEVVVQHDAVLDCAVAAATDEAWGEMPVAFVVPRDRDSFDQDAVVSYCAERLARYKVPARIRLVETIPRTGSGKVQRYRLREDSAMT